MKYLIKYYRELIILVLALILGVIIRWNYIAKQSVRDIKEENQRIKSELQVILEQNEQSNIIFRTKRDSLLQKLDSLQIEILPKENDLSTVIEEIKDLSSLQNSIIPSQKDSIWKLLKQSSKNINH